MPPFSRTPTTPPPGGVFVFGREDVVPVLVLVALPFLAAAHLLLGWLVADPLLYTISLATGYEPGPLKGVPYADPNNGYQTQALGYRAALDWLSGMVPWWNPYSGVGLPLAGEYQPGALSPLTLTLLLPNGTVVHQVLLQLIAGLGTYGLLRQLRLGRLAATVGGLLFAFNGTLAWFAHGPATAVPYLPWLLWGIERAHVKSRQGAFRGWRMFAVALAASLLSGFPETAYINGLLALAWALLRLAQARGYRGPFAASVVMGGLIGLAIASPQLLAFFTYLPDALVGDHDKFARAALPPQAIVQSILAPYVYGPIMAHRDQWPALLHIWGGIGGYATAVLVVVAVYGYATRPHALHSLLLAWILLALGKTFLFEPAVLLWNLVPGVTIAAFARYVPPTWIFALIVLAATGLDALARGERSRRGTMAAALAAVALAALGFVLTSRWWPEFSHSVHIRNWAIGSAFWALATCVAVLILFARRNVRAIAALLVIDAMLMYVIPTLSNPRNARLDHDSISFLRDHVGLQRVYSLGPLQPNYGAYFGIASINHNYLPVSRRWAEWVQANLDPGADAVVFNGAYARPPGSPSAAEALRERLEAYRSIGVKYVVAPPGIDPFEPLRRHEASPARVHRGATMDVFELPSPAPYVEARGSRCDTVVASRTRLTVSCDGPATLVRRELFFRGWTATVNGNVVPVRDEGGLFQAIPIPAGRSDLRFAYAPPFIGWAWLAAALGLAVLMGARFPRVRRPAASAAPAATRAA